MKHDNANDNLVNGFYKATKTSASWSKGRQYYFRDGYTVDDNGEARPCGVPLEYRTSRTRDWMKKEGLVPATDEMDIFDRVNDAAVTCRDVCDCDDCSEASCPYADIEQCRDQMIEDFSALRKMLENRKEQEYEAMPIQGGFVYDNKRKSDKCMIVGCLYRDKETLEVFRITDVSISQASINRSIYGILVDFESIDKKFKMGANLNSMDDFYEQFEAWVNDRDGGSFDFVAIEDLSSESDTRVFKKGHLYSVVEGKVCNCDCDMRFRDFSEMAAYFGGGKLIRTVGQGPLNDPTEGLYTGMAVYRENPVYRCRDSWRFTKGKIYRFVNGVVKDDVGARTFVTGTITDYFVPVKNLEVGGI